MNMNGCHSIIRLRLFVSITKWCLTIGVLSIPLVILILPFFILPHNEMEEFHLIRHHPPHNMYSPHLSDLKNNVHIPFITPCKDPFMIHAVLQFPLAESAISRYIYNEFINSKIVHVSIYETAPEKTWCNIFELNKTIILLTFLRQFDRRPS